MTEEEIEREIQEIQSEQERNMQRKRPQNRTSQNKTTQKVYKPKQQEASFAHYMK